MLLVRAPLASLSLAGQEHGRTIPLTDVHESIARRSEQIARRGAAATERTRQAALPMAPNQAKTVLLPSTPQIRKNAFCAIQMVCRIALQHNEAQVGVDFVRREDEYERVPQLSPLLSKIEHQKLRCTAMDVALR